MMESRSDAADPAAQSEGRGTGHATEEEEAQAALADILVGYPNIPDVNKMPPNEADVTPVAKSPGDETAPLASSEDLKVKFIGGADGGGKADDVKVEIEGRGVGKNVAKGDSGKNVSRALNKAELMKYATDPKWVAIRWVLFIAFWVLWVAMIVSAIVIIVLAPKCPTPAPKQWWQKAPIYEVYVKSFKDSNDDGVGDIKGIISELDYLADLGVGSVWLSPVYKSPMKDQGYDIQDFRAIDPIFGDLEDFKDLLGAMHDRDLKLIMDFVPNHSSDQHEWFQKSVERVEPYTDYYIWRPGKNGVTGGEQQPPTNWKSVFGGSAWEYNEKRGEYYLHQFYKEQPDLNLRNPKVKEEMINVLRYWLDLGVDGFRIDSVAHFFEDQEFKDEGVVAGKGEDEYASVDHKYTYDLPEVLDLLKFFRAVLDEKTAEDESNPRIMMSEAYLPVEEMGKYYGDIVDQIGSISQMPLNFDFITNFVTPEDVSAEKVHRTLTTYLKKLPDGAWSNYNLGNHDNARMANRFSRDLLDAMHMVVMMLQGTPITYYGDEIGMVDATETSTGDQRDPYRTPMQWSNTSNAGFTKTESPWLSVNPDYIKVNVAAEKMKSEVNSHLKVYKKLAHLHRVDAILFGDTNFLINDTFFSFTRVKKGNPGYLVAVNFGNEPIVEDVTSMTYVPINGVGKVTVRDSKSTLKIRNVDMKALSLGPKEGIVLAFVPQFGSG